MKKVALIAAVGFTACSAAAAPLARVPLLDRTAVARVVVAADEARATAFSQLDASILVRWFRDPALATLQARVAVMNARGVRVEEQSAARTLLAWDPQADEAVLEVEAEDRVVTADRASKWSGTLRRWWSRLAFEQGSWWIVAEQDLPPDRWRGGQ